MQQRKRLSQSKLSSWKIRVTSLLSQNLICLKNDAVGTINFRLEFLDTVETDESRYVLMSYGVCISAPQFPAHHAREKQKSQLLRVVVALFF